jgi:hypothetical protein
MVEIWLNMKGTSEVWQLSPVQMGHPSVFVGCENSYTYTGG